MKWDLFLYHKYLWEILESFIFNINMKDILIILHSRYGMLRTTFDLLLPALQLIDFDGSYKTLICSFSVWIFVVVLIIQNLYGRHIELDMKKFLPDMEMGFRLLLIKAQANIISKKRGLVVISNIFTVCTENSWTFYERLQAKLFTKI